MATYFSILVWRIPWSEEPGGLQSMGLERVGHDWVTNTHTWPHPVARACGKGIFYWAGDLPARSGFGEKKKVRRLDLGQQPCRVCPSHPVCPGTPPVSLTASGLRKACTGWTFTAGSWTAGLQVDLLPRFSRTSQTGWEYSSFILLHVAAQLSQHHLLKRPKGTAVNNYVPIK